MYIKKNNFIVCDQCEHQKITFFSYRYISELYSFNVCIYMYTHVYICIRATLILNLFIEHSGEH